MPLTPDAYTMGKSHCSSLAPRSMNSSKVESTTHSGRAAGRSILFTTTTTWVRGGGGRWEGASVRQGCKGCAQWAHQAQGRIRPVRMRGFSGPPLACPRPLLACPTFLFSCSAFLVTKRVCGIGPSTLSTSSTTPSHMLSTRSTSPPKSA